MKVVHSDETAKVEYPSLFLAGPTPRSPVVESWRPKAIHILEKLNYKGMVFVPEYKNWGAVDFIKQVEWEWRALEYCTRIVFWVPRNMETMPALTTNVEFGSYIRSGRAYYGRPDGCPHNTYLDWLYNKTIGRDHYNSLEKLLEEMVKQLS